MRAWLLVLAGVVGCSGGQSSSVGYTVMVNLQGSSQAFQGRMISVEGVMFPVPPSLASGTEIVTVTTAVCTLDHDAFLNHPLRVVVASGANVVWSADVPRFACKFGEPGADEEIDGLFLNDDGSVESNSSLPGRTPSGCTTTGSILCRKAAF
jgi:hypothetical protein